MATLMALAALRGQGQPPEAWSTGTPPPEDLTCPQGWVKAAQVTAPETRAWTPPVSRQLPGNYHRGMALAFVPGKTPLSRWWYQVTLPGGGKGALPAWESALACVPTHYLTRNFPKNLPPGQAAMVVAGQVGLRNEPTTEKLAWLDNTRVAELHQGTVMRVMGRAANGWLKVRPGSLAGAPLWYLQAHDLYPIQEPPPAELLELRIFSEPPGVPHVTLTASRPLPVMVKQWGDRALSVQIFVDRVSGAAQQAVLSAGGKLMTGQVTLPLYFQKPVAGFVEGWNFTGLEQPAAWALYSAPPPVPPPGGWRAGLNGLRVVLDPGHGAGFELPGWKEGGRSKHGGVWYKEETFTLAIGLATRDELTRRGATVLMTREGPNPSMMSLYARSRFARLNQGQVFISHHTNAGPSAARGVEVYYFTPQSRALAQAMVMQVAAAQANPARKAAFSSFGVLRHTAMPAVLIEHAFHSNPAEAKRLTAPDFYQQAAFGVAEGLTAWLEKVYPAEGM